MTDNHRNGGKQIEDLILLAQERLDQDRREELESLIANDSKLASLYQIICELVAAGRQLKAADISTIAQSLGEQIFVDYQRQRRAPGLKHAITLFDSKDMPLPQGVRPAAVDTRRLKYQLPRGQVEIEIYPISLASFEIVGMILDAGEPAPYTIVVGTRRREQRFTSDKVDLFRIPRISRGKHDLRIYSAERLIGTIELEL